MNSITHDETLNSRDIIKRFEELDSDFSDLKEAVDEAMTTLAETDTEENKAKLADANLALETWNDAEEYQDLQNLIAEAESSPDWHHGEVLIREDYFTMYIEELINECYEIPKSESWPHRHMTMDYDAAAEEAKPDYNEVQLGDTTYLIRA